MLATIFNNQSMKEFLQNLYILRDELNNKNISINEIIDKLELNIRQFFQNKEKSNYYLKKLYEVRNSFLDNQKNIAVLKLNNFINLLIEDTQLINENDFENEKNSIINQFRRETEIERKNLQAQLREINRIKNDLETEKLNLEKNSILEKEKLKNEFNLLEQERKKILDESIKFDEFKKKLEVANKQIDFRIISQENNKAAIFWGIMSALLIAILFVCLYNSMDKYSVFSEISLKINSKYVNEKNFNADLIKSSTYFGFAKYITSTLLLYSFLIFCIIFCIKNYNSQMHNKIINQHKSNALNSILSLLDTAKSDDGNDKLLIQATQAIFSHQNSGYNNNDCEPQNPNLVTNVIESVSKKL